jgi:hypothetical protein
MSFASDCKFFLAVSVVTATTQAVAAPAPEFGPNPAVGWLMNPNGFQPSGPGAGPIRPDPSHPGVGNDEFRRTGRQVTMPLADVSNPILQPWTREALRKRNELVLSGKAPSLGIDCGPIGGVAFLVRTPNQPYFFVQAPDRVIIINQDDHQFRHIYLTAAHSRDAKPSWSGESIGHYEGDELVVDTIGIEATAPVDRFFTPHTDKLHMTERFRLVPGGDRLDVRVHVEDPGAFNVPWDARISYERVEPGRAERKLPPGLNSGATVAGPLIERSCAENPFSYFGKDSPPVPHADRPDF